MRSRLVFALALVWSIPAWSAQFVVNSTVDAVDANPGDAVCETATADECTLRAAVMEANATAGSDSILVPSGTHLLTIVGSFEDQSATGDLDALDDLTILGADSASSAISASGLNDRVLDIAPGVVVDIRDLAIGPAFKDDITAGGCLRVNGGTLRVLHSMVRGCSSVVGGGVAAEGSARLELVETIVSGNYSQFGGSGVHAADSDLVLVQSQVINNFSDANGASALAFASFDIEPSTGSLMIEDSIIANNTSNDNVSGAVVSAIPGRAVIRNTTIANNHVQGPQSSLIGGLGGTGFVLENSTVSGNVGNNVAGGVYGLDCLILFSTITDNEARVVQGDPTSSGGGLVGDCEVRNTIIAGNRAETGPDCASAVFGLSPPVSGGNNLIGNGSDCGFVPATGDLVGTSANPIDPQLGPSQDNGGPTWTHALLPGSQAIDAIPVADCTYDDDGDPGTPEVPVATDQRGVPRPQLAACDIGAYEVTECADGVNNDTDAFIDGADPGCQDAASVTESPQCQDGINNDPGEDDFIDFDGGLSALGYVAAAPDPQCKDKPWRNCEWPSCCGLGFELALILPGLMWLRRRRLH